MRQITADTPAAERPLHRDVTSLYDNGQRHRLVQEGTVGGNPIDVSITGREGDYFSYTQVHDHVNGHALAGDLIPMVQLYNDLGELMAGLGKGQEKALWAHDYEAHGINTANSALLITPRLARAVGQEIRVLRRALERQTAIAADATDELTKTRLEMMAAKEELHQLRYPATTQGAKPTPVQAVPVQAVAS